MSNIKDVVIPEGWKKNNLGKYLKLKGGYAFKSTDFKEHGVPILRISDISKSNNIVLKNSIYYPLEKANLLREFKLKEKDIVIAMSGATTGKVGQLKKSNLPLLLNQRVGRFDIVETSKLDNSFLYQYILSDYFYDKIWDFAIGGAQPNVSGNQIEGINILIPKSLQEQQKIAEILSTVDEAIDKTDVLIEKYKKIKTGLMEDLFTRGVDVNMGKPHTKFKESELGRIPESWEIDRIENIALVKAGPFGSEIKITDKKDKGFRVYNQKTVIKNDFKLDKFYISRDKFFGLQGFEINPEDILITSRGTIGKILIFPEGEERGILHPCLIKIACNKKIVLPKFLSLLLSGDYLIQQISLQNSITTIGVIYGGNLKVIKIKIPTINEQEKIIEILSEADRKIEKEEMYKEKLERIKKGLMNDLLTGAVRVQY